jgi:hypothetical protein
MTSRYTALYDKSIHRTVWQVDTPHCMTSRYTALYDKSIHRTTWMWTWGRLGHENLQIWQWLTWLLNTRQERCRDKNVICIWTTLGMDWGDKELFFYLVEMTILNIFLLLSVCGNRLPIVPHAKPYCKGWESTLPTLPTGQPVCFVQNQVKQLEVNFSSHWPLPFLDCIAALFSAWGIKNKKVKFEKCDVGTCLSKCSQDCQTKLKLWCINWRWQVFNHRHIS